MMHKRSKKPMARSILNLNVSKKGSLSLKRTSQERNEVLRAIHY